jgi:predicted dehydrogenase
VIKGEDAGIIYFEFENGVQAVWDASRFNESSSDNPRYTFGEMVIEGSSGTIRLYNNGNITIQTLGSPERVHAYVHGDKNFAGDCVFATQEHFVNCLLSGEGFETNGLDYLKNIEVQEATYSSSVENKPVLVQAS